MTVSRSKSAAPATAPQTFPPSVPSAPAAVGPLATCECGHLNTAHVSRGHKCASCSCRKFVQAKQYTLCRVVKDSRAHQLGYRFAIMRPNGTMACLSPLPLRASLDEARALESREAQHALALKGGA